MIKYLFLKFKGF